MKARSATRNPAIPQAATTAIDPYMPTIRVVPRDEEPPPRSWPRLRAMLGVFRPR